MNILVDTVAPTAKAPASLLTSPPTLAPRFLEPAGLRWGRFATRDGATLRWAHLAVPTPTANVLLLGGFTEFIEKYFELLRDLAARGFSVWCLDWRGQGGSERSESVHGINLPPPRDFDRDAADLADFMNKIPPQDGLPRFLIAHSMGGAIAMLALKRDPALVNAAMLSAPMFEVATGPLPTLAARTLAWFMTAVGAGQTFIPGTGPWRFDDQLCPATSTTSSEPERCLVHRNWFASKPSLRIDGPTFAWAKSAFDLTKRFKRSGFFESIATPILIGSAACEAFVGPRSHRAAAARLPHARLVEFPHAKHELFMEKDEFRDAWLAEIEAFASLHRARP
jgi:lysophospholipase